MKRMLFTTAAICAVMCFGLTAYGQSSGDFRTRDVQGTHYWSATDLWQTYDGSSWSDTASYPGDNTKSVTMRTPSSGTLTVQVDVTDAAAAQLTIQTKTVVSILGSEQLEIAGNSTVADSDGLVLSAASATLHVSNTLTLSGTGSMLGQEGSAKMTVADSITLTSQITIHGMLQIAPASGASSTAFVNDTGGLVLADAAGILDVRADSVSGAGTWRVSHDDPSTYLRFTTGSTNLTGPFQVYAGQLDVLATVSTTGDLDFTGGSIHVDGSQSFSASQ